MTKIISSIQRWLPIVLLALMLQPPLVQSTFSNLVQYFQNFFSPNAPTTTTTTTTPKTTSNTTSSTSTSTSSSSYTWTSETSSQYSYLNTCQEGGVGCPDACPDRNAARDSKSLLGMYDDFKNHPCNRPCVKGVNMKCVYHIYIHHYNTSCPECQNVTACEDNKHCVRGDGLFSSVILINHQLPAPPIRMCYNDTIIAVIFNNLKSPTTIHWHGLHFQKYPESDGAPFTTQYLIGTGDSRTYYFVADRWGTLWYHPHFGRQRAEGAAGAFIVRLPTSEDPHADLYDFDKTEHSIVLHDRNYNGTIVPPVSMTVNGRGRNRVDTWPEEDPRHCYARFRVAYGKCYRFRVISNGVSNCPMEFSIQNHSMLVISLDGNDIKPVKAGKFHVHDGERVDVVVCANKLIGAYWITVTGFNDCRNLTQRAILEYEGVAKNQMPKSLPSPTDNEVCVNTLYEKVDTLTGLDYTTLQLQSLYPLPWKDDVKHFIVYLQVGLAISGGSVFMQINHISYAHPNVSFLHGCQLGLPHTCNITTESRAGKDCKSSICQCTQVIDIPANTHIEVIVGNSMGTTHPMHWHGYTLAVVGQGSLENLTLSSDIEKTHTEHPELLKRINTTEFNPVRKDVVQMPPRGYIIVRFFSNNLGYWLVHCHIEFHTELGMVVVFRVGDLCLFKKLLAKDKP